MGPWRAVDAHNGSVEAQNGALDGLCKPIVADSHHFDKKQHGTVSESKAGLK
jgi:hypothetical protein